MALWNMDQGFAARHAPGARARRIDLAMLVICGVAPGLFLLALVPISLVLPTLSIVSFVLACAAAVTAHHAAVDQAAPGITLWDVAALFTAIWIGAAMISGPKRIIELFERLIAAS
jgi:hypothetical protein